MGSFKTQSVKNDDFKFEVYRRGFFIKFLLIFGLPTIGYFVIRNFMEGKYFSASFLLLLVMVLVAFSFTLRNSKDEIKKYRLYRFLLTLFIFLFGLYLIYAIGVERAFFQTYWSYIFVVIVFFALGIKEGLLWVFIFYCFMAFFILYSDFLPISVESLKLRFLISFFLVSVITFVTAYLIQRYQKVLLSNKQTLNKDIEKFEQADKALRKSEEEAKRLAKENSIIAEIGRIISSTLNIEDVYERFAEEVRKVIPLDRISVNIINPDRTSITIAYSFGAKINDPEEGLVFPLDGPFFEYILNNQSGFLIHPQDESELAERFPNFVKHFRIGIRTMMAVPLISKDQVIGILHFQSLKPKAYTETDLRIAERVGSQIAGAIANAQLLVERRQTEEKYRTIVRTTMDGFWIVDMQGRFIDVNDAYCGMIGYSRDELLTMRISDVEAEETPLETVRRIQKIAEVGGDRFETHHKCKDGRIIDIEVSVNYMEIGGGQMFVFLRDITERKRAEEVLRESEARYRTILENIQDGYFEVDLAGNCTFANEARCQSLGYTKEELIGMNNRQFVEKETSKKVFEVFNRVYRTGEPVGGLDEEVIRKDGTKASSEISISLIRDLKGDPIGFRGISRDITGRKRAENALRIEKQRFQTLLENAPFGMVMIDKEGNFKYINSKFIELFGYDLNDVPNGREWFNKAYPDPEYRHHAIDTWINDSNIYELGEKIPRIFTVTCKDRTKKIVRLITVQLEMGEYLLSCEDITMIQQAEEQKAALEEQLRQSQRVEAVGRLAGGIAHEFNNLMTVIEGYGQLSLKELSLIEKLKENDSLRENVEEILKASQRATDLTSQFLSFSRRQIMDMKVIDLNSLLGGLDKMLRLFIGEHIELAIILAEDLGRVKIDPGQFEQVILNLALNARDAMPGGGRLIIETQNVEINDSYVWTHVGTSPGQYVMFSLTDTGCGMSPEIKTHIFEPFFTTKEIGKGVGLGLATVYGIVKQSCGNIWVYSEPGQGTTFKIYLPRIDEAIESSRPCPAHMELPKGSETILLVEDEEPVRSVARKILNSYGYRVLEAVNGEQALHLAEGYTDKIHLLFTDVVMPQMSGKELAGKLKALRPDIKVLFASGYTDNAIVYHGLLYPGTNFLQKPFSPEALAQKVREVLGRRE